MKKIWEKIEDWCYDHENIVKYVTYTLLLAVFCVTSYGIYLQTRPIVLTPDEIKVERTVNNPDEIKPIKVLAAVETYKSDSSKVEVKSKEEIIAEAKAKEETVKKQGETLILDKDNPMKISESMTDKAKLEEEAQKARDYQAKGGVIGKSVVTGTEITTMEQSQSEEMKKKEAALAEAKAKEEAEIARRKEAAERVRLAEEKAKAEKAKAEGVKVEPKKTQEELKAEAKKAGFDVDKPTGAGKPGEVKVVDGQTYMYYGERFGWVKKEGIGTVIVDGSSSIKAVGDVPDKIIGVMK